MDKAGPRSISVAGGGETIRVSGAKVSAVTESAAGAETAPPTSIASTEGGAPRKR
jgi:hypothetical protein